MKDEVGRFVELFGKLNINLELVSNYPWIYLNTICGKVVSEKKDSEHGYVIGYYNKDNGTRLNDIGGTGKLIRKYVYANT